MDTLFALSVLQIVWIDILLSGDNAVVIALACRSLQPRQRRIGIALGVTLALALRIALAAAITFVLAVPYLKIVGGLLLLWIAIKVIRGEDDEGGAAKQSERLMVAVGLIVVADLTMSLDNVVAIAAAARGNDLVFAIGLAISMPLMIVGASLITALIARFPLIVWAGGGLLGWVAGGMLASDAYVLSITHGPLPYVPETIGAAVVLLMGFLFARFDAEPA